MPTSRARARHGRDDADDGGARGTPPFAPPFLKAGKLVIGQTANILLYLGSRHGLAPKAEAGKLWVHQLQLTVADFVLEIHDTHHPLGPVAVLRGPAGAGEKAHRGILEGTGAEISRLFRAAAEEQRRRLCHRPPADLCRSLAVPDRGGAALRLSEAHEGVRARNSRAWSTCTTASPRGRTSRPISPATAAFPSTRTAFSGATRSWICRARNDALYRFRPSIGVIVSFAARCRRCS